MKRIAMLVGIGVLLLGAAVGAETVVSTHAVLGEFAQIIGEDAIEVVTIIPSGFCPAHYDLCPSDLAAVVDASVILYSGFEPWMETLIGGTSPDNVVRAVVVLLGHTLAWAGLALTYFRRRELTA